MYATKFKESGHTVETAENGPAALSFLKDAKVDVVLLDMVMPGMDGIAFLEAADAVHMKEVKFIVLSNQSEESDREKASKAGASGYIVKAEAIPSDVVAQVESLIKEK